MELRPRHAAAYRAKALSTVGSSVQGVVPWQAAQTRVPAAAYPTPVPRLEHQPFRRNRYAPCRDRIGAEAAAGADIHRVHIATDDVKEYGKALERLLV